MTGEGHLNQMLFAIGNAFLNGTNHITGFANANTHLALFVANYNDGPEAHFFTAFNGFGNAADLNNPFLPFGIAFLISAVAAPLPAAAALTAGRPVVVLAGRVEVGRREWAGIGVSGAYSLTDLAGSAELAMLDAPHWLREVAARAARSWSRGLQVRT